MKNWRIYWEKRRVGFVTGYLVTLTCGFILLLFGLFGYYKLFICENQSLRSLLNTETRLRRRNSYGLNLNSVYDDNTDALG